MSCTIDIQARIDEIQDTDLPAVRAAIRALVTGNHQRYELDTGQSRQSLQRLKLSDLREYEKDLVNELNALCSSIGTCATIARAGW